MNNRVALCQDCMRVHSVDVLIPDRNNPPGRCPVCRGDTCDAPCCIGSIPRLAAGDWRRSGIQKRLIPRCVSWAPDSGLVLASEPRQ